MADLFDLQAKISLDSSEYEKGLKDAEKSTEKSTESYRSAVMKLAQEYKNSGATMSEAMKRAYSEIDKSQYETEKVSKSTSQSVEDNWSDADVSDKIEDGFDDVDKSQKETEDVAKKTSKNSSNSWDGAGEKIKNVAEKIGNALKKAFEVGAAALGVSIAAVGKFAKDSIGVGAEFDSSMSQVAATLGMTMEEIQNNVNGAGDTFNALRDKADEMGRSTNFSASQAAEGLNILAMSGFSAGDSIDMVEDVLHLAAAGSMDMASAAGYISGAMKGFADDTKDAQYYADLMAKGATLASTSVAELGDAMSSGAAGAAAYGQSSENMTIALLRLAEQGDTGAAAGTALSAAMKDLYTPTDQGADALKKLGVAAYNMDGSARDVNEVVNELSGALSGMSAEEANAYKQTIFGIQGLNAYNKMAVTGIDTQERWANALAEASEGAGEAAKQYNTMTDNLQGDVDSWNSAMDGLKIAISDQLMPTVREFVQFGTSGMSQLTDAFKSGGLSGAMEAFGEILSDGLNMIIEGLPEAVEAGSKLLGALVRGIISNIPTLAKAALEIIQQLSSSLIESLPTMISSLSEVILQIGAMISDPATLETLSKAALEIINQLGTGLVESLPAIMSMLTNVVIQIGKMLSDPATLNTLIQTGISLLMALLQGLFEALPQLTMAALQILQNLGNAILDNLPLLIESGISILNQYLDTITENLPLILEMALSIIMELANGIIEHLPELVTAAISTINRLVEFLTDNLDMLVDAALEIVLAIVDFLIENVDQLVDAAIEIIVALANGLISALPKLLEKAPEIIMKLVQALIENAPKLLESGVELIGKIVEGLSSVISQIWDAGKRIVEGLWQGISDTADWLWEKVSGWVGGLVDGIKGFLGIHSPSTVLADIGEDSAKGYGEGFVETMEDVGKDMQNALNATVEDLQNSGVDWDKYSDRFWMTRGGGFEGLLDELRYNDEKDTLYGELLDYLHYEYDFAYEDAQKIIEAYNSAKDVANLLKEEETVSSTTKSSTQTSGNGYRGLFGVDNVGGTVTNTITINVHPSEGMDEKKLADIIERKLMAALDRREAAWA